MRYLTIEDILIIAVGHGTAPNLSFPAHLSS